MSTKRIVTATLVFLSAVTLNALAQSSRDMDPDVKNYKLSMEKVKAYDGVVHKLMAAAAADPSVKGGMSDVGSQKTLTDMVAAVERNARLMAVIKPSGLTTREFCVIPMGVMAAGGAYMIKTQYKKDASSLATAENLAFYEKNKDELERITNSWMGPREK